MRIRLRTNVTRYNAQGITHSIRLLLTDGGIIDPDQTDKWPIQQEIKRASIRGEDAQMAGKTSSSIDQVDSRNREAVRCSLDSIDCISISDLLEETSNNDDGTIRNRNGKKYTTNSIIDSNPQCHYVEEDYPDYIFKREHIHREITSEVFFHEYVMSKKPCIIQKLCDDWPSMKYSKWTTKMLLRSLDDSSFIYNNSFTLLHKENKKNKSNDINSNERNENKSHKIKHDIERNEYEDCVYSGDFPEYSNIEGNIITLQDYLREISIWENETLERQNQNQNQNQNHNYNHNSGINNNKIVFDKFSPNVPYIFDPTLSFGPLQKLLNDYTVPTIFCKEQEDMLSFISNFGKVNYRWFLLGSRYSGSSEVFFTFQIYFKYIQIYYVNLFESFIIYGHNFCNIFLVLFALHIALLFFLFSSFFPTHLSSPLPLPLFRPI